MKKAFTMIELVFVIVILGILAGIAIPKLLVTRDDAVVAKLRTDVASIRSGIELLKSKNLLTGDTTAPDLGANFSNVVTNGIKASKNGKTGWIQLPTDKGAAPSTAKVCIKAGLCATYTYNKDGTFVCSNGAACDQLE